MSCAMMGMFGRRWIVGTCATMISAAGPYGGGDDFVIIYLEKKNSPRKKGLNLTDIFSFLFFEEKTTESTNLVEQILH